MTDVVRRLVHRVFGLVRRVLRVFMAWKPLEQPQEIEPQQFAPFLREGFTVVEWGGTEVS